MATTLIINYCLCNENVQPGKELQVNHKKTSRFWDSVEVRALESTRNQTTNELSFPSIS